MIVGLSKRQGVLILLLLVLPAVAHDSADGTSPPAPPTTTNLWENEQALEMGTSAWYRAVAASGRTVHLFSGDNGIFHRRSLDEGETWSDPTKVADGRIYLEDPVAAEGENVYLVFAKDLRNVSDWCCGRDLGNVYVRISRDKGVTWEPEVRLSSSQGMFRLSVAASGSSVHVVWMGYRSGVWDVYYRRSLDEGRTWEPEFKLVSGASSQMGAERPQLALSGNYVHVVWMDGRDKNPSCTLEGTVILPECTEVYYKRSSDLGSTWEPDVRFTSGMGYAGRPDVSASDSLVAVVFDNDDGTYNGLEQMVLISLDNGSTWSSSQRLSFAPGDSGHGAILAIGPNVQLAWHDRRDGNFSVFFRASINSGATWLSEERISSVPGSFSTPLLAATVNFVHAIWLSPGVALDTIFYRRRRSIVGRN